MHQETILTSLMYGFRCCPFYCVSDGCTSHIIQHDVAYFAGTFHSVGCQIVRRHVGKLGDTGRQPFAIFDQDDTKNVMKLALKKYFALKQSNVATAPAAAAAAIDELADDADGEADDASPKQTPLPEWVTTLTALLAAWAYAWQTLTI